MLQRVYLPKPAWWGNVGRLGKIVTGWWWVTRACGIIESLRSSGHALLTTLLYFLFPDLLALAIYAVSGSFGAASLPRAPSRMIDPPNSGSSFHEHENNCQG